MPAVVKYKYNLKGVGLMKNINNFDNFTNNPISAFKNAGYYKHRVGWKWEKTNEFATIYCIESGVCQIELGGAKYLCNEGDVIFIKDFENVKLSNYGNGYLSYYFISFFCEENYNFQISTVTKGANALYLFKNISKFHRSESPLYKIKIAELFLRLIYILCSKELNKSKDSTEYNKLLSAVEYININYFKKITPEYLSKISGYSPAHLRRLFVRNFGVPPMEFILNKKVNMAKEMLLDAPEKTLDEIADLVGFCSASYLCKIFKRQIGLSPLEYKNKHM